MAGRRCVGGLRGNGPEVRESKAYCEGMAYRASDTASNVPVTDNPHEADSPAAIAWDNGWNVAQDALAGVIADEQLGCCAQTQVVPV